MAAKHLSKPVAHKVGHEHCGVCGACLLHTAQNHKCPSYVSPDVIALMLDEMKVPAKGTPVKRYDGQAFDETRSKRG